MASPYRIGLIGFGNIGTGLVRHVQEQAALLAQRLEGGVEIAMIADREFDRPRGVDPHPSTKLTTNWREVTSDPTINAVVELVGVGADGKPTLALDIARAALSAGKDFVTANKGLIAAHGGELEALARANNAMLLYEASVGAGIPLLSTMQIGLAPNQITRIDGIVNGTCNYILTRLEDDKSLSLPAAIKEAQELGYAEPDPSFDVNGDDAGYKIVILASLAFQQEVPLSAIRKSGITRLGDAESKYARENGLALKLLASARRDVDGGVEVQVSPVFLPSTHVLANVRGVFNAVLVEGEPIGQTLYYGRGAGQASTASGLLSDVLIGARIRRANAPNPFPLMIPKGGYKPINPASAEDVWYVRVAGAGAEKVASHFNGTLVTNASDHTAVRVEGIDRARLDSLVEKLVAEGVPAESVCCVRFIA